MLGGGFIYPIFVSCAGQLKMLRVARDNRVTVRKGASGYSTIFCPNALYRWRESLKNPFRVVVVLKYLKSAQVTE